MGADITNRYGWDRTIPHLPIESAFLYCPVTEWTYSHHPSLTWFAGRYFAMWSNGRHDEDAPGQRVMLSVSTDFRTWEQPRPLSGPLMGRQSELVLTAAGFHQHGGTLAAYVGQYEYRPEALDAGRRVPQDRGHMDTTLQVYTSADGLTWQGPNPLHMPIVPNHPPQATASGRLIISGNISFPYSDDPTSLGRWTMAGIYPSRMDTTVVDDSEGFGLVRDAMGWPCGLCEGSFFQTDDGVIHMLLRSGTEHLWLVESRDDGETWSRPTETTFTDNVTKFHFGRLPDGRYYYLGCPDPAPRGARPRLVLSLSEDGIRFDRHAIVADAEYTQRQPGLHKGGLYGYPHTLIHGEWLHVICSLRKEAIQVLRIPLAQL